MKIHENMFFFPLESWLVRWSSVTTCSELKHLIHTRPNAPALPAVCLVLPLNVNTPSQSRRCLGVLGGVGWKSLVCKHKTQPDIKIIIIYVYRRWQKGHKILQLLPEKHFIWSFETLAENHLRCFLFFLAFVWCEWLWTKARTSVLVSLCSPFLLCLLLSATGRPR